jgi:LmbE family N-acetylglucosaminyl deacetylase
MRGDKVKFKIDLAEREKMKNRIILLAHPDDEVFFLPYLFEEKYRNYFVYLTSGKLPNQSIEISKIRQDELSKSLKLLGTQTHVEQIFLKNVTQDSVLYREVNSDLYLELLNCIDEKVISECCTMKFEGGHQDHDITNVLARLLCASKGLTFREFIMYSASSRKFLNFKIDIGSSTGSILKFQRLHVALFAIRMMKIYRSQWRSWIGLSVPLIYSYICRTWRDGFANPSDSINFPSVALYELRKKASIKDINSSIQSLRILAKES